MIKNTLPYTHVLVTGGAGFIGSHVIDKLLAQGVRVTSLDNLDPFYPPEVKRANIAQHLQNDLFQFVELDISDGERLHEALANLKFDAIIHLAAKAGVRPSIQNPIAYQQANVMGTQNLLEYARHQGIKQFVFASSSSVYGVNPRVPWQESDHVLEPISPYASTKVAAELLGHVYAKLFDIRFLALRFFTVYGPRQRPDLAIHKFARMMLADTPIPVFGDGTTRRDYTFVDDVVKGVLAALVYTQTNYEIINLGNSRTVSLAELIEALEVATGKKAIIDRQPMQPGDVPQTFADTQKAKKLLGYAPDTPIAEGLAQFMTWIQQQEMLTTSSDA